jgi:HlyD family secretion protein
VREAEARLVQARTQRAQQAAQLTATQRRIAQVRAGLTRISDVLRKHNAFAPLDGVVTNLPVRVGETVVPGIQIRRQHHHDHRRHVPHHLGSQGG